jgi:hypothetical protein
MIATLGYAPEYFQDFPVTSGQGQFCESAWMGTETTDKIMHTYNILVPVDPAVLSENLGCRF